MAHIKIFIQNTYSLYMEACRQDKTSLLLFIAVSLIVGQLGVWVSFLLTLQNGEKFHDVLTQNLASATMYTYSISIVVSSVGLIISEIIDAFYSKEKLDLFEQKLFWSIVAGIFVIFQATLAGPLLSEPASQKVNTNYSLEILLWVLSMMIALHLYTLYRIPLIPQHFADDVNKEVRDLNEKAKTQNETSFGEKV